MIVGLNWMANYANQPSFSLFLDDVEHGVSHGRTDRILHAELCEFRP